MRVMAGTSGFSYKEWNGNFYPEDLPAARMLGFYSERLPTVEINNTFYRMPRPELLSRWLREAPADFHFVLKAPQRITHQKRLVGAAEDCARFFSVARELGDRRGPTLFQLPPFLRKDLPRLRGFLAGLPDDARAAFEFRHSSWFDEEVYAALRETRAALCVADSEALATPFVGTAGWGYLRLRRPGYSSQDLEGWAERVRGSGWHQAYVFFKHEDQGTAPRLASAFAALFDTTLSCS